MAIQNLNSLNNPVDFNINKATEEYLIQALANLGQRYSIKGDGIGITTIKFADLFTADVTGYNSKTHIGKVSYDATGQNVSISIVKADLTPIEDAETISMSESNTNYIVDNDESSFTTMVNETGLVRCSDTLVYADEHSIVYSLVEHTSVDNNDDEPRYVCQKYDKYTNELVSGLRIMKTGNEASGKTHSIIYMQKTSEDADNIHYLCYIFDVSLDADDTSSTLGSYTVLNEDDKEQTINIPFTINGIATKFVRYHGLNQSDNISDQELNYAFTPESVFSQIYTAVASQMTPVAFTSGDNNSSVSLSKTNGSFLCTGDISEYSYTINMFAYDKTYVYNNIKEYYSTSYYKSGVNSKSLINKVLKGLLALVYGGTGNQSELYVSLEYAFEYAYNTNDPWQVYFSTHDIAVRFASLSASMLSTKKDLVFSLNDNAAIICVTTGSEKMAFYNYDIEYENSNEDKNIYGVRVIKHFELPYINEYGYWVINGVSTEMYAHGKDAGNPNIVIVESVDGETKPSIITMADKDYFSSLPWVWKTAKIKLPSTYIKNGLDVTIEDTKINENDYVECKFMVPSMSAIDKKTLEEHIDKLKYSILINIAKVNLINGYNADNDDEFTLQVKNIFGADGRMSSIWVLDKNEGSYDFVCKTTENDGYAIDFNYMSNMDNLIGFAISNYIPSDPDNFMFSHVVFDAPNYGTKQRDSNENTSKVYPMISNTPYDDGNKFNMSIQYLDTIEAKYYEDRDDNAGKSLSYEITSLSQSNDRRYLDEWIDEDKPSGHNLYSTYMDYIPNNTNYSVPILDLSETLVKDNNVLNRVSIMTLENGTAYYSYIGSLYYNGEDEVDKSVFVIGTSERNINLGTKTLVSEIDGNDFTPQREIDINFENTRISAYAYVGNDAIFERDTITYGTNWTTNFIGSSYYWNCSFIPVGEYYGNNIYLSTAFNTHSANIDKANGTKMFARAYLKDKIIENDIPYYVDIYMCDAVDVKCLLNKVMPQVDISGATITSNKSIIKYGVDPVLITLSTKNYIDGKTIYHGSQLNISYYMSNETPFIEINENEPINTLVVPQKINLDYDIVDPQDD